ncbi:MBL fold metallo-hydrolase [Pseudarthrobacter sulfonivorans]|uniref:MBL fold metallo-hydrolase n=1 Tax=Pseudarthrobacter sulfonivorans TaxID=121292 RepID=UPI002105347F|nr:MBL fold metallo-hydrolase [Pseudarthrobacter sulfonivorans]
MVEEQFKKSGASDSRFFVEPVIQQIHLPAGIAGPYEMDLDVRCFLVGAPDRLILIDAGPEGSAFAIDQALQRVNAPWSDVTDIVLTHSHPDHVGGLDEVVSKAPGAAVWAGAPDIPNIPSADPLRPLREGDHVGGLRVLQTPGHTSGHISLLDEDGGVLFVGDALGTLTGAVARAPSQFTSDAAQAEESLRRLSETQPTRMLFSHGPEVPDPVAQLRGLLAGTSGT